MKITILAALVAIGVALAGASPTTAAPASGTTIGEAAATTSPVTKVPCAVRRACGPRGCVGRRVCW